MIPTGQEEEGEDQEIIHTLQLTADSSRRITLMIRQIRINPILVGAEAKCGLTLVMAVRGKGNAAPWIAKRVADWLGWLGSETVTLKCDNEPAILALAQEIRRLRRDGSITIFEHPEEERSRAEHR